MSNFSNESAFTDPTYSSCKLWTYGLSISLGSFQFGYSVGVYNPISMVLMQLYDNAGQDWSLTNKEPYNSLVSTVPQVGAFIGSLLAFLFVKRRLVHGFFIFNFFAILGAALSLFLSIPLLLIGRFISGFSAGNFSYLVPIMLSEISPRKVRGAVSNLTQNFISVGVFVPSLIGLSLPHYTFQVHENEPVWRIILGFPAVVSLIQIFLFLIFFRHDPPSTYFKLNDNSNALKALKLVYTSAGAKQRLYQVLKLRESLASGGSSLHKQSPNPPRALFVCILLSIFNQLTGISSVLFYSSQIFSSKSDPQNIYSGIIVSALVGSVSLASTFISLLFVD